MDLKQRELIVVMPVYNEAECIAGVVNDWRRALLALDIDFQIWLYNDGSKDDTAQMLERFIGDDRVRVTNKPNSGHGPTILGGYREAVRKAKWVFQCDSDDEMKPDQFAQLWKRRARYVALFGFRAGRAQDSARKLLSGGSRVVVKLLFGRAVRDVNVPYRLMRSDVLKPIVDAIPTDTFAPNVLIAGVLSRQKRHVFNYPVPHEGRKTGTASLTSLKVWKVAARSLVQTLTFRMPKSSE